MITPNQAKYSDRNPIQRWLVRWSHRTILKLIVSAEPAEVLEVGCGEGHLLAAIGKNLPAIRIMGVDNNSVALAAAHRAHPDLDIKAGDIYHLPEADHSWDTVVASEVLEHLATPEIALAELQRVARRQVVLTVPHEPFFRLANFLRGRYLRRGGNHPEHVNLWTGRQFIAFVTTRMTVTRIVRSFPLLTIILARP